MDEARDWASPIKHSRGEVITTILIALIAVGILVGGLLSVWDVKCQPKVQQCIEYPGGSFEAPK
jgi:hypothetical protein